MRIFVSWSGEVSHQVALVLREWLQQVVQTLDPFVSSKDIDKGERWDATITDQLEACDEGIVVVTADNQDRSWLNFEAGALSKQKDEARVRTVLFNITNAEVTGPLGRFQSTNLRDKDDVWQLVKSLAEAAGMGPKIAVVQKTFETEWPELIAHLETIEAPARAPRRSDSDMITEILNLTRGIDRRVSQVEARLEILESNPSGFQRALDSGLSRGNAEAFTARLTPRQRALMLSQNWEELFANLDAKRDLAEVFADSPAGTPIEAVMVKHAKYGPGVLLVGFPQSQNAIVYFYKLNDVLSVTVGDPLLKAV